jgi:phenylpropionate dioxygenase-like ring-hydroxylating dioxygenase large terminal subunit
MSGTTEMLRRPAAAVPGFAEASNRRQQARAAGLHPDHWYPVERDAAVRRGSVREVMFQGRSIALFRGADGQLAALENRCAHRQLKLSLGTVEGCQLTCPYHGWSYDGSGRLAGVPHDLFGRRLPKLRLASFPLRVRYGLVWIFPGDAARAEATPMPEIPEIEGPEPWATIALDFTWRAHHSMLIENVSDFTHAHLHRKYRPFSDARLTRCETVGDTVQLAYETLVGDGRISRLFVDRSRVNVNHMELALDYPYQRSDTDGKIKHWCFFLPIDARTTRAFFIFYFDAFRIPFTRRKLPRLVLRPFIAVSKRLLIRPLLSQDGVAVEAEQEAYESCPDAPAVELNPAVGEFQKLIARRWAEHLAAAERAGGAADAHVA